MKIKFFPDKNLVRRFQKWYPDVKSVNSGPMRTEIRNQLSAGFGDGTQHGALAGRSIKRRYPENGRKHRINTLN